MKLFFAPRTRAVRARWLLEELGVPYELLEPLGEVPTLVDGDVTLRESLAICLHLADRFPEKHLAPPPGSVERGLYFQWMVFAEGHLDAVVMELRGNAPLPEAELAKRRARLTAALEVIAEGLGDRDVLVGGAFSAADVVMVSILHLAHSLKLLGEHPRLEAYVRRHTQRPAVRKAVSG